MVDFALNTSVPDSSMSSFLKLEDMARLSSSHSYIPFTRRVTLLPMLMNVFISDYYSESFLATITDSQHASANLNTTSHRDVRPIPSFRLL